LATVDAAADEPWMPTPFSAPRTPWNRSLSSRRTVAFGTARRSDLKEVTSACRANFDHVVLAACTQTLRSDLKAGGGVPEVPLVAAIPVSLGSPDELGTCGTRLSALFIRFSVTSTI
jgi:hypothetical protein